MLKAGTAARRRSLRAEAELGAAAIRAGVERFLGALDRRLQQQDPTWVGHCKLLVSVDGQSAYASVTAAGDKPRWAGGPTATRQAEITVYVAIYSWKDADVAAVVDAALAEEPLLTRVDVPAV